MTGGALAIGFAEIWLLIGAAAALIFLTIGIGRVEEHARGAYAFRPLLIPGILLLWPIVLWRWFQIETRRNDDIRSDVPLRDGHGRVWIVLVVLIPLIILISLSVRQDLPAPNDSAVRISAPKR
jgi:hypothetical protein